MKQWRANILASREVKAMPIMTYPGLHLIGKSVRDMVTDADVQFRCIKALAERYPSIAALSGMDLSVEAEAFGSNIRFSDDEIPTAIGAIVTDVESATALQIPQVGSKRTAMALKVVEKAANHFKDRPVIAGCIGPFSLAGRLMDMNKILLSVRKDPVMVHVVLEKCTNFLTRYLQILKSLGANGVVIAEPAAGLLSPAQCSQFSSQYVARIVSAIQDNYFSVILHNCGNTAKQISSLLSTGAHGLHLGCTVDLSEVVTEIPSDVLLFGNIEPAGVFLLGTPMQVEEKVHTLLTKMQQYPNFVLSSGCDIPPGTSLENLGAFFGALARFNSEQARWSVVGEELPPSAEQPAPSQVE
jgi:uroporphyrinogen decarboxylase